MELREHQIPAVEEIARHFRDGVRMVVLSAPVGSGKTFVAEASRRELGYSGLYVCTSKTLMNQFTNDFPDAHQLKGRANYPTENYPEEFHLNSWKKVTTADCTGQDCTLCSLPESCPYQIAKSQARSSPLVCTNTAYFLNEANHVWDSVTASRDLCVIDEGDTTESLLMGHVEVSINPTMQKRWGIWPPEKKTVAESWAEWLAEIIPHLKKRHREFHAKDIYDRRKKGSLKRLIEKLQLVAEDLNPDDPGWVFQDYERGNITFRPIRVHHLAPTFLWPHAKRFLVMSATIDPVEEFIESTGWDEPYAYVEVPSTFPPANRPVYYTPVANVTKQNEDTAVPRLAKALRIIMAIHPNERILVHTSSYRLAKKIAGQVDDSRVIMYSSAGEREGVIQDYEETPNSVLLASSMERGWSGDDDLCRVVVLMKVPYPHLDKQTTARLYSFGGQDWYRTATTRLITQSLGRAVRHQNDAAVGYILDSQFGKLWRQGSRPGGHHRNFPTFFTEALHLGGKRRKLIDKLMKK